MNQQPRISVLLLVAISFGCIQSSEPMPTPASTRFRMVIDDSFALNTADMVVVVGIIANGEIRPGDKLLIETPYSNIPVTAEALEAFHEPLEYAKTGDRAEIKLKGAKKDDAGSGNVLIGAK